MQKQEEENDPMEDSEDGSNDENSSDSSDEEMEHQSVDDGKADRIEAKLMANPYSFELHVEFVQSLRAMGDLERLRNAREKMQSIFPLPQEHWLAWIDDEQRLATSDKEIEHVLSLFERATKEYQSIPIWVAYISFAEKSLAKTLPPAASNLKKIREVFEASLVGVGLHPIEGNRVWHPYREFENKVLKAMEEKKDDKKEITKQVELIRSLFRRQLSIPAKALDELKVEYKGWEEKYKGKVEDIENNYKQAVEQYEERKEFELSISKDESTETVSDYSNFGKWKAYIEFEESKKDPKRIIFMYERTIRKYFLVMELWQMYLTFLEHQFGTSQNYVLGTYQRAVRNILWSGTIWAAYLRAMEKFNKPAEEVAELLEKALVSGLQTDNDYYEVFQAYADYERRKIKAEKDGSIKDEAIAPIRAVVQRGIDYIGTYFPSGLGLTQLQQFLASFEVRVAKNHKNARDLYEAIVKRHHKEVEYWAEYLNMERGFGDTNYIRSLFKRAVHLVKDYPEKLWNLWLQFEREFGNLETFDFASKRITSISKDIVAQRQKEAEKAEALANAKAERKPKKTDRKRERNADQDEPSSKRQRQDRDRNQGKDKTVIIKENVDAKTAFVVNLPFTSDEDEIEELFAKYGKVVDIRIVKNEKGKSKGYAYVEFEEEEMAQASLVLDQTEFKGRTLKVSISQPKKPKESYSDEKTVFVSNLPLDVTEEQLKAMFAQTGKIKEIRIIKGKGGVPKGFAYIDFEDEQSLTAALQLDQREFKGKALSVARSKPPKSGAKTAAPKPDSEGFAVPPPVRKAPVASGTPKPRAMLVPRAMRKPAPTSASSEPQQPLSNDEFRKKFLQ